MSALMRPAASAAPRILAARRALTIPPLAAAVASSQEQRKGRTSSNAGGGGSAGAAGRGGGPRSASPAPAPGSLDLDALLSDRGAVDSMRTAIRDAMVASRSSFEKGGGDQGAGQAAAAAADRRGSSSSGDRRPQPSRGGPASGGRDRDSRDNRDYRDRDSRDNRDCRDSRDYRGGNRDSRRPPQAGYGSGGRGGGRGGRRGDEEADPQATAARLAQDFRLDLSSTALGRAAQRALEANDSSTAPPVYVAVLLPNKTRLFDEQEAASPSLVQTLAGSASSSGAAPPAAGASPMVFGGAVALVAQLAAGGRCSPAHVTAGGASLPQRGGGGSAESAHDDDDNSWRGPEAGDPILVATPDGRALAWGCYNGASMFRVRVLQTEAEVLADEKGSSLPGAVAALDVPRLLSRRVREAAALRRALGLAVGPSAAAAGPKSRRTTTARSASAAPALPLTDVFRLVNGEGDRLSGLVADQMGPGVVVVQSNAAWVERHRPAVERALRRAMLGLADEEEGEGQQQEEGAAAPPRRRRTTTKAKKAAEDDDDGGVRVVWRRAERMLREEGVALPKEEKEEEEEEDEDEDDEAATPPPASSSSTTPSIIAHEDGMLFAVRPEDGQKTGFYADQRDNRAFVARLVAAGAAGAAGAGSSSSKTAAKKKAAVVPNDAPPNDVLDLCCYSGGFALAAARAGATRVDAVDSSVAALALARENAALNGVSLVAEEEEEDKEQHDASHQTQGVLALHKADASAFLSTANAQGQQWRVVVLDPPKLAPTRRDLERALRKYRQLNAAALRAVRPGGFLITHSCSGAVARQPALLQAVVNGAAALAGRQVTLVREGGAAGCHPLHSSYPEGRYLTSLCFRVL